MEAEAIAPQLHKGTKSMSMVSECASNHVLTHLSICLITQLTNIF